MTLWGGRFRAEPGEVLWSYTRDLSDRRLLGVDIEGSIAHVEMLAATGILATAEAETLLSGLRRLAEEAAAGELVFADGDEDVHSAVERRLGELIGEVAGKLHTGRSRNDQVALDVRLYARRSASARIAQLRDYALALADLAERHAETVVPSYTHLQQAQPTTLGHHLLAYAWMALRDADRFEDLTHRLEESPLGAGASAGTSLPIDPGKTAERLGLGAVFPNSLDAVASRDLLAEYAFCSAQAMVSLSRLAGEIVLWSSSEFGRIRLDDTVTTGSSALPHKRNPDLAELVRGRSSRGVAALVGLLMLQKGLPLAYNRDLQEDKPHLFAADDTLGQSLEAMAEMLTHAEFLPSSPHPETASLDLAEALVGRGVPFREAHRAVGALVLDLEAQGRAFDTVTGEELRRAHPSFTDEDLELLHPEVSVRRRVSPGGGSPDSVREQVARIRTLAGGAGEG